MWQKLPELKTLEVAAQERGADFPELQIKERIRQWKPIKNFDSEKILRKIFLKIKILLLKAERKTDQCLHRVSHSQRFEEDYWDKFRKK